LVNKGYQERSIDLHEMEVHMNRSLLSIIGPSVALALAVGGCEQGNPTGTHTIARQSEALTPVSPDPKLRTIDDDFADVAAESPGFGGLFYDTDGTVNVYLLTPSRLASATGPITSLLQRRGMPSGGTTRVLQGQYDYRDLLKGYQALRRSRACSCAEAA
jgi:hypothetical protein